MTTTEDINPPQAFDPDESTLERLIRAARERFAHDGFNGASLDAIVADAGLTKGSLYHHFDSKADLFSDVYEDEQAVLSRRIGQVYAAERDPWDAAYAGIRAFLDVHMDAGVQRITLVDAPSALGWERMRELGAPYGLALMEQALRALAPGGLRHDDIESLAHLLLGALIEGAMFIARAEDPQDARRRMERELEVLLETLAPRP